MHVSTCQQDSAAGWFLHLYGGITLLVSSAVFGWLVMPLVHAFDAEKSKLQKRSWNARSAAIIQNL